MGSALGQPNDVERKLIGLEGQFQPSCGAHGSPDGNLLQVEWLNQKAELVDTVLCWGLCG
jgi:hypothetical protein